MLKRLTEGTVIFLSVLKWFLLATIIGALVGAASAGFIQLLNWGIARGARLSYYYFSLPAVFFLSALIIKYLAPEAEGHGTEKVIEAVHKRFGRIKAMVVPVKLVATVITLAAGGSAGKEGPCAQIGGGLASIFADIFRFTEHERKKFVICGVSAGFAAVFGTPIAGAIFGVEVLFIGNILYDVLLPSFIAGITSYHISSLFGITYFYHPVKVMPVFSEIFFLKVILAGVFFGLCSFLLIECMQFGKYLSERIKLWAPWRGALGGCLLVVLTLAFSSRYLGLGLDTIEACLREGAPPPAAFLLKMVFTSITLNFGGSGGVITPVFFVGATAGSALAHLFNLDASTFAALGLVSLLAGAANTPIAASILAMELFGTNIAPYAAAACIISFLVTGHRSIYPSQVLAIKKAASLNVELGKEIEDTQVGFDSRTENLLSSGMQAMQKLGRTKKTKS